MFGNVFPKIVPFVRKCGKKAMQPDRPNVTIRRMRTACCIPKAKTHTLRICNTAFLLQQWLQARSSVLRCMYTTVSIFDVKY